MFMDYLFYGNVTVTRNVGLTMVSLDIECEPGEFLALYVWQPNDAHQLAYQQWPCRRLEEHFTAQFDVSDDQMFLFTMYAHGHENDVPVEVAYTVYNGDVIELPENSVSLMGMTGAMYLIGTTIIFPDGMRKLLK
jgi:hypothetical protein